MGIEYQRFKFVATVVIYFSFGLINGLSGQISPYPFTRTVTISYNRNEILNGIKISGHWTPAPVFVGFDKDRKSVQQKEKHLPPPAWHLTTVLHLCRVRSEEHEAYCRENRRRAGDSFVKLSMAYNRGATKLFESVLITDLRYRHAFRVLSSMKRSILGAHNRQETLETMR